MDRRRVLLLGATGLVGRELLSLLLMDETIGRIVTIARRTHGIRHPKLHEYLFDLAMMPRHPEAFEGVQSIFCALGTTMKTAGSKERFYFVDHDLPLLAARTGLDHGAQHFLLVSSLGANRGSRAFYPRVKGEVEEDLQKLAYPMVTIVRPSFLLGPRREFRLGEQIVTRLGFLMPGRIKPIDAHVVARALLALSRREEPGVRIVESRQLKAV